MEYCTLHRAEANIIPLGIRKGYPEEVDFIAIQERLTGGWIGKEMVVKPGINGVYDRAARAIAEMRKTTWNVLSRLDDRVALVPMPG